MSNPVPSPTPGQPPATTPSPGVTSTPATQPVNHTPANPAPATTPGQPKPHFKEGDFCNHPGSGDGVLVSGVGKVVGVDKEVITVECDQLGKKRITNFKESDLTKVE